MSKSVAHTHKRKNKDSDKANRDDEKNSYFTFPMMPFFNSKPDKTKDIFAIYRDREGKMESVLTALHLTNIERVAILNFWSDMDRGKTNTMSRDEFHDNFNIDKTEWSSRVFDIFNYNLNGVINFVEFLYFCLNFLLIDKRSTETFTFRLMSRRASTYNNPRTVLDLDDVKFFVRERYTCKDIGQRHRRSLAVFSLMDSNGDGGLSSEEFYLFCHKNNVFVKFAHIILMHFRKVIFGTKFWINKTREINKSKNTSFINLHRSNQMNIESENYFATIGDPIVDEHGVPLDTASLSGSEDLPSMLTLSTAGAPATNVIIVNNKVGLTNKESKVEPITKYNHYLSISRSVFLSLS